MKPNLSRSMAREIMLEFADLTGLLSAGKAPGRYLWTDAFAVCNFLEIHRQTKDEKYRDLALRLVDQVHNLLGRHREDDSRTGWISRLDEEEGKRHPTKGGLRIGKKMNERKLTEPLEEDLEWDRDGQYYHYLTKWMHALNCVSRVTGDFTYNRWAMELANTAHAAFTYVPMFGGQKRMYWKMSIDLTRPLVPSMGQHDPLDGFITYTQLQATAAKGPEKTTGLDLTEEIADMAETCKGKIWVTGDPLGIGGLLSDAYKAAQLMIKGYFKGSDLLQILIDSSLPGLESYARMNPWNLPARYRLAFRELGLSIGLRAVERLQGLIEESPGLFKEKLPLNSRMERLRSYTQWGEKIEKFWLEEKRGQPDSWINPTTIHKVIP
jgi:hypothetical protein